MNLKEFRERKIFARLLDGEKFQKYDSRNATRPYPYSIDISRYKLNKLQLESPYLLRIVPNQEGRGYIFSIYAQYEALNINFEIGQAMVNTVELDTFNAQDMPQYVEAWLLENRYIEKVDSDCDNNRYRFDMAEVYSKADLISKAYLSNVISEYYYGEGKSSEDNKYKEWIDQASKYVGLITE